MENSDPDSEIFNAPLDITFQDITAVQPDLLYVSGEQKEIVQDDRIDGSPTLVVEILFPSTRSKDRIQKLSYQKTEVQHYWISKYFVIKNLNISYVIDIFYKSRVFFSLFISEAEMPFLGNHNV